MIRLPLRLVACALTLALATITPVHAATGPFTGVLEAGGQRQWVSCDGAGSPTLVLVSGLGASHDVWAPVLPALRSLTRVCVYDRPGLGSSPARRGSRSTDAGEHARELRALLRTAGEEGPFLILGHSYGGLIARAFAAQRMQDVAGLLLLEGVHPGIEDSFLPSYRSPWHEGGTSIDMHASSAATTGGPQLGATPLVVITAGRPGNGSAWADKRWNQAQEQAAGLSSNSVHWIARRSGHVVQRDQPAIVVRGLRWLLQGTRPPDQAAQPAA